MTRTFFRLPSGFFGRLNDGHIFLISSYIKNLVIGVIITNFGGNVKGRNLGFGSLARRV